MKFYIALIVLTCPAFSYGDCETDVFPTYSPNGGGCKCCRKNGQCENISEDKRSSYFCSSSELVGKYRKAIAPEAVNGIDQAETVDCYKDEGRPCICGKTDTAAKKKNVLTKHSQYTNKVCDEGGNIVDARRRKQ